MSATTLNKSDHIHTDLYVMTAPDSLSAICTGLIAVTQACFHPNPKQGLVYITYHTEGTGQNVSAHPPSSPSWMGTPQSVTGSGKTGCTFAVTV